MELMKAEKVQKTELLIMPYRAS